MHQKYGSEDRIVKHCLTVANVAKSLTDALASRDTQVNERAVQAGALLHDIGRTRTQTVQHGFVGSEMLRLEGVDPVVVDIVKKHVGAGISSEEAVTLGLPKGDYVPSTLEEKVVCFADKMVSGEVVRPFDQEVTRFVRKGHDVERLKRLKVDVSAALGTDAENIVFG